MPIYEVSSPDVWGNAAEGYEINGQSRHGLVYVPPQAEDREIIQILTRDSVLSSMALEMFDAEKLGLDDHGGLEVWESETEWAAVRDGRRDEDNVRYLDVQDKESAEEALEEGERAQEVEGQRPILLLEEVEITGTPLKRLGLTRFFYDYTEGEHSSVWVDDAAAPRAVVAIAGEEAEEIPFDAEWEQRVHSVLPSMNIKRISVALDYLLETGEVLSDAE